MLGFARLLYGGSDIGIYNKVLIEYPDFEMSFNEFKEAIQRYMDHHPDYVKWVLETQETAKEGRITLNSSGRVRTLYGSKSEILRQALNTPIQGSAADEVSSDIILLYQKLKPYKSHMILQIHDELLFNLYEDEKKEVGKIIHDVMTRERVINGFKFRIPIDAEIGTHWGSLKPYNLLEGELVDGRSKHVQ